MKAQLLKKHESVAENAVLTCNWFIHDKYFPETVKFKPSFKLFSSRLPTKVQCFT